MRILQLVAGAGEMYCGTCLAADALAGALVRAGHDVVVQPLYTPIRTEGDDAASQPLGTPHAVESSRILLGGVNVYLQQVSAAFGFLPRSVRRWLSRPALLRWLGRRASSTQPESLGPLTVSMLRGQHGRQRAEIEEAVRALAADARPDVVHLSTILLAGLAAPLRQGLGAPVVASLSGEDVFLDRLPPPYREDAQALLQRCAGELAALIAPSRYFARKMAEYLAVPAEKIVVVPPGMNLSGHRAAQQAAEPNQTTDAPRVIGYLGRLCLEKGLHIAAEALKILAADPSVPRCVLRAAGYLESAVYADGIGWWLHARGLADRFEVLPNVDRAGKIALLQSADLVCFPSLHPEAKALPLLEALADGVPVVAPDHGAFPEWIEQSGGGLLFRPNDAASLAEAIKRLLLDGALAAQCARRGLESARGFFHSDRMAADTAAVYRRVAAQA